MKQNTSDCIHYSSIVFQRKKDEVKMTRFEIENEIAEINNEFGLIAENGEVTTTSLKVAEIYGKQHKHVLDKIDAFIHLIPELGRTNFRLSSYINEQNKEQRMYIMDRQGFSMLVNKYTGDEATIFTYKYTKAFERMVELIELLSQENEEFYQIAISDECQLEREYKADKIKYAVRNIERILSSVKYTELEDTIDKIIDVHTHLKKRDRYEYHKNLTNTEYKKRIMAIIDEKLDNILLKKSDMLYHTVAQQLQKNLKDMYIETTNRSTSQLISNRNREIAQLKGGE